MSKKGVSLSVNTIVVVVLALLVFVIVLYLLQSNISKSSKQYLNLTDQVEKDIQSKDVCAKMFSGRYCYSPKKSEICPEGYSVVYPLNEWKDCDVGQNCCESD
ncbi:hypothetical protein KY304_01405 [Candidatus Woesearchaeota archaeon]|nr:hypothetical protein [Candidatus Woesearchaeota archaeon]MBW2978750.1 hypothetical protein [Candidatus Woesearchaeota archaeon]